MSDVWLFSGGGMRIYWHVGVSAALRDLGKRPKAIIGTSAGALIAAALSYGNQEILEDIVFGKKKESDVFTFHWWNWLSIATGKRSGKYSLKKVRNDLDDLIGGNTKKVDAVAVYVNWNTGVVHYASNDEPNFKEYVLASSSIPGIMEMIPDPENKDQWLVDGGVREQIALKYCLKRYPNDKVYAVGSSPLQKNPEPHNKKPDILNAIEMSVNTMSHEGYQDDMLCHMNNKNVCLIFPDKTLDIETTEVNPKKGREIYELAYEKAMSTIK